MNPLAGSFFFLLYLDRLGMEGIWKNKLEITLTTILDLIIERG
jgi:hypothetical protein